MTNRVFFNIEKEDFAIRLHPKFDDNKKWTGEVIVGIVVSDDNPMNDEDYGNMLQFTNMLCSCVGLMEDDKEFREAVYEYYEEQQKEDEAIRPIIVKDANSNVIRLNFNTRTDGSA